MKKLKEKLKYGKRGITLIALVVTIVILLILAGVTINTLFSDNGIIKKAQDAGNKMNEAINDELTQINDLTSELMEIMGENPRVTDIYVFLYDDGTLSFGTKNEPIEGKNVLKEYGNIKGQEYTNLTDEDSNSVSDTPWFNDRTSITTVSIIDEIVPLSTANWFHSCENLTEFENIERLDTSEVTDMSIMFYRCSSLSSLDLSSFDTSKLESMASMFLSCTNLTSLNLSSFNTSNVTSMGSMFGYCSNLSEILGLERFNTDKVKNMGTMFYSCTSLTSLNLSSFNTSNVTSMGWMFEQCRNLTSLDLSSFNTSNVTNMTRMFYKCSNLTNLNLSSFNTNNVTNMGWMFDGCRSLTSLDLSSFETENVISMENMFANCTNLATIYVGDSWNILNVENKDNMFTGCGTNTTTPKENNL